MTFGEEYIGALTGINYEEFMKRYKKDAIVNTLAKVLKQQLEERIKCERMLANTNTLDKQRVKSAILKVLCSPKNCRWQNISSLDFSIEAQNDLLKELGLEE